ncbi:HET-domain-containing protein [Bimuria novae-zelandiae CBS 107.79]|uniref:HET-domain-containing protein n=1 Tax=Bimuria novae-zelandiae CBS 107.79 TaxID=1447943 RepID=A0A6A5UQE4_9PLEO|nr:HET-domain-containing protein [Bimuria novae-zelandiae CBS 107.79]
MIFTYGDEFVYQPIQKRGYFDTIAQSTVFRFVGPKATKSRVPYVKAEQENLIYQPLEKPNGFRLLVLEPGEGSDRVSCRLVNVVVSWRTQYEALSYTWGDPAIIEEIICNGHKKHVTANLQVALRNLRFKDRPRILWVDALCINQDDLDERQSQVVMMDSIYSGARQVLIWLGEENNEVKGAFQVMKRLECSFKGLHRKRYISNRAPFLDSTLNTLFPTPLLGPDFEWEPVLALLRQPWFQRMWIIQEAILPKRATVICGQTVMPWYRFEKVLEGIQIYSSSVASTTNNDGIRQAIATGRLIMVARAGQHGRGLRTLMSRNEDSKMLDLLLDSRTFQCTNHRDRIYGFLGVAKDKDGHLQPDYRIGVEEVFRRFVIWDINRHGNLRVLSCSSSRSDSPYKLPSWVPDFANLDDVNSLMRYEKRVNFRASFGTTPRAEISTDGKVLTLGGMELDSVAAIGRTGKDELMFLSVANTRMGNSRLFMQSALFGRQKLKYHRWIIECMEMVKKMDCAQYGLPNEKYKMSEKRWDEFWRTMTCNHNYRALRAPSSHESGLRQYMELLEADSTRDEEYLLQRFPAAQAFERSMIVWAKNRRFCSTKSGRIGWVPRDTKENDLICVLYGGQVPYVLRPCEGGYKLVGECYIHGLMEGEAIEWPWQERKVLAREANFPIL